MEKLNIAIADDNEIALQLLDEMIDQTEDMELVGKARNGQDAYEMIKAKKPDIVLLDLVMPKMDGLSVMEKIHKLIA